MCLVLSYFLADEERTHGVPKARKKLGFAAKSARSVACVTFRRKCDKMPKDASPSVTEGDPAIQRNATGLCAGLC